MKAFLTSYGFLFISCAVVLAILTNMGDDNKSPISTKNYFKQDEIFIVPAKDSLFLLQKPGSYKIKQLTIFQNQDTLKIVGIQEVDKSLYTKISVNKVTKGWVYIKDLGRLAYPLKSGSLEFRTLKLMRIDARFLIATGIALILFITLYLLLNKINIFFIRRDFNGEEKEKPLIKDSVFIPIAGGSTIGLFSFFYSNIFAYYVAHPGISDVKNIIFTISFFLLAFSLFWCAWQSYKHYSAKTRLSRTIVFSMIMLVFFLSSIVISYLVIFAVAVVILLYFTAKLLPSGATRTTKCEFCGGKDGFHTDSCKMHWDNR